MDINATEVPFQAGLFRVINKQRITVLGDYEGTSMRLFAVDFHVENRSKTMAKILWPNGMRTAWWGTPSFPNSFFNSSEPYYEELFND